MKHKENLVVNVRLRYNRCFLSVEFCFCVLNCSFQFCYYLQWKAKKKRNEQKKIEQLLSVLFKSQRKKRD